MITLMARSIAILKIWWLIVKAIWRWHLSCWREVKGDFKFLCSREAWRAPNGK